LREVNPDVLIGVKLINYTSRQYISGMVFAKYHQKKYSNLFKKMNFLQNFLNNRKQDIQLMVGIALRAMDIASKDATDKRIQEAKPDLLLEPNIEIGLLEFDKAEKAIQSGRDVMEEQLPNLKKIIS
jgi:hypothetical protein